MEEKFYLDEDCLVSFWVGEIGWFLQRWQAFLRYLKKEHYQDHKFLLFCNPSLSVFVRDYVYATIDLPDWYKQLGLDSDCYEGVLPGSPAGGLMPSNIYSNLINDFRTNYNTDKATEVFPPRGCNYWVDQHPQLFCQYKSKPVPLDKDCIVVFPRARVRAANRNVPKFVWYEIVETLRQNFIVVLAGTPSGACLVDYQAENVINLIQYNSPDKTEKVVEYLNTALCSISSQSGGSHISLLSGCPTYMVGHEEERHARAENRLNIPTSFRTLQDYRAIDAQTMVQDALSFIERVRKAGWYKKFLDYDIVLKDEQDKLDTIIRKQRDG